LFGLFPRRRTIAVGSGADLVIWDPVHTHTISATDDDSQADFSLYEGWEVTCSTPSCAVSSSPATA
jgi:dihydropyrimidinase